MRRYGTEEAIDNKWEMKARPWGMILKFSPYNGKEKAEYASLKITERQVVSGNLSGRTAHRRLKRDKEPQRDTDLFF